MPSNEPKSQEEKSREAFTCLQIEKLGVWSPLWLAREPSGEYIDVDMQLKWELYETAWQASRTQLIAELAEGEENAEELAERITRGAFACLLVGKETQSDYEKLSLGEVADLIQQDRARVAARIEKQYEAEIQGLRERVRELEEIRDTPKGTQGMRFQGKPLASFDVKMTELEGDEEENTNE
jgi:hypothetical protein